MLTILMIAIWGCFVTYVTWYLTLAKHYAPITFNDAKILWKIHKQSIQCHARKWRQIKRGDQIIGFECECGHKHIQKRPIAANTPTVNIKTQTKFDKMKTSCKSD